VNRLKGGLSPMPVGVVHVCIAFREAVAVVRLARYISQQFAGSTNLCPVATGRS